MQTKKEARQQNKKRKLQALAVLTKLNETDKDREQSKSSNESSTEDEPDEKRKCAVSSHTELTSDLLQSQSNSNLILSDEDYNHLKLELNQKKRELKNKPKLRLKLFGENAALTIPASNRTPIFLTDIQHLIMYSLFGSTSPCIPTRWCHLEKVNKLSHTAVVILNGLSLYHFSSYESQFEKINDIFEHKIELVMPDKTRIENEIMMVPITNICQKDLIEKYGSLEAAIDSIKNPVLMVQSIFPVADNDLNENHPNKTNDNDDAELFPRTQLLLSALQMVDEGYPLPLRGELANRYKDFVMTKDNYKEVTAKSPMFGVDCEMCRTSAGMNELTRISIINENHESIYETLVCPQNKIVDYLTQFSGITPQMMLNVTKTLAQVQNDVRNILPPDAILVGQSLQSDLMAMRMMHPYVIDTSVIFNISGDRRRKSKLQTLASEFLGETIQKNPLGHDSIEDCSASLKLTKLKLQNGIDFGDAILANRKKFNEKDKQINPTNEEKQTTINNKMSRNTAVITSNENNSNQYERFINEKLIENGKRIELNDIQIFPNNSNKNAVRKTCEVVLNHTLTITHLNIYDKMLEESKISKSIKKIDQWISNIWQCIAPNGLLIVIFGSDNVSASGVAMLQIKR